jgi:mono/diheme cytochrome c family protein
MTDAGFLGNRAIGIGVIGAGMLFGTMLAMSSTAFAADASVTGSDRADRPATFAKDVAPILQARCQECHRKGAMAPMSLVTYDETRPWAKAIRERVAQRQMPPWHINKTVGVQSFKNDRSLTDEQINTIVRWVDAGAPMGDPKDMPPAKQWPNDNEWQAQKDLGAPDFIIEADPYTMAAHHQDVWWRPVAKVPVTEPRWVRAVEMRPTVPAGRRIVHHAVAYLDQDDPGAFPQGAGTSPDIARRGMLMEWAIGKQYDIYRPNTGKLLLPGSEISWDVHIHAVGEEIRSGVQLAVWLYPKGQEPKYRTYLTGFQAKNTRALDIPPNTIYETQGFTVLKQAARLENIQPHMHLRGKAMNLEAILPDGTVQEVSYVDHFSFNWMTNYIYSDDAAPEFPKGTMIHVTAWYDNTRANKNNPDPDQEVMYGDRTVDEMGHAWVNVTYISDEDYNAWAAQHKPKRQTASAERTLTDN